MYCGYITLYRFYNWYNNTFERTISFMSAVLTINPLCNIIWYVDPAALSGYSGLEGVKYRFLEYYIVLKFNKCVPEVLR